jgi:thiamine biosynthesis protein ThiI
MAEVRWVLRLGEVTLKSKSVRRLFQDAMRRSMAKAEGRWDVQLKLSFGRDRVVVRSDGPVERVEQALAHQLGLVAVDRVRELGDPNEFPAVANAILDRHGGRGQPRSFGVRCRRTGEVEGWSSLAYAAALGAALIEADPSLSVNLKHPDWPVNVILRERSLEVVEHRMMGPGGLPVGAQGDVLAKVDDERDMLSSFLIMRRGCRILPIEGSDGALVERLRAWDANIGRRSRHHTHDGHNEDRPSWGCIGLRVEEAEPLAGRQDSAVKTTPLATLDPLLGWSDEEVGALMRHFDAPWRIPPDPNAHGWMATTAGESMEAVA